MQNQADFLSEENPESEERFYMANNVTLMQYCLSLFRERKSETLVEVGIHHDGSIAFLYLLAKPKKRLALKLAPERLEKVDQFIQLENLAGMLKAEFGVDQADVAQGRRFTEEHFGRA